MKALVNTFLPLCIFSFIAFGISVAVLGFQSDSTANITSEMTVIDEQYSNIELNSNGINISLFPSDRSDTVIYAEKSILDEVSVEVKNDTLTIECNRNIEGFDEFFNLFEEGDKQKVEIAVPDIVYNNIIAEVNAGATQILSLGAECIDLQLNAGDLTYSAPEGYKTSLLMAELNAGNCTIYNAQTDMFELTLNAGNMDVYGLSGNGNIETAAGSLTSNFAKLNGNIDIEVRAGSVDLNLPEDASAYIDCEMTAGEVSVKHTDYKETLTDGDTLTIADGQYSIICDITAGSINVSDNVKLKSAPATPETRPIDTAAAVTTAIINTPIEPVIEAEGVNVYVDEDAGLQIPSVKVNGDKVNVDLGVIKVDVN